MGFNFGYLHQVYASSPSLAALARVVCSPSPLPRCTRQRGCSWYSPASPPAELRGRGSYPSVGLRHAALDRRHTGGPRRRRPLARGPTGAVPPRAPALPIWIGVRCVPMVISACEAAEEDGSRKDRRYRDFYRS